MFEPTLYVRQPIEIGIEYYWDGQHLHEQVSSSLGTAEVSEYPEADGLWVPEGWSVIVTDDGYPCQAFPRSEGWNIYRLKPGTYTFVGIRYVINKRADIVRDMVALLRKEE